MADIDATSNLTLADVAKITNPDQTITNNIVEILNESNPIIEDMVFKQGNLTDGYQFALRSKLPKGQWKQLYRAISSDSSGYTQVIERTANLQAYAEIDAKLADLSGNIKSLLASEEKAYIEGLGQQFAEAVFYSNSNRDAEQFLGLAPRYNNGSSENAENIIDAGGRGSDNASIWIVNWSDDNCGGLIPKNGKAGLQREFIGKQHEYRKTSDDKDGRNAFYITHFDWDLGMFVRDWRSIVRIANIDRSQLSSVWNNGAFAGSSANLPELIKIGSNQIRGTSGRMRIYCDRTMKSMLERQLANATQGSTLSYMDVGGKRVSAADGIPIRVCDALKVDEAHIPNLPTVV